MTLPVVVTIARSDSDRRPLVPLAVQLLSRQPACFPSRRVDGLAGRIEELWAESAACGATVLKAKDTSGNPAGSLTHDTILSPFGGHFEGVISEVLAEEVNVALGLVTEAEAKCVRDGCRFLYAETGAWLPVVSQAFQMRGWRLYGVTVRYSLDAPQYTVPVPPPYRIRLAKPSDTEFILACLIRARVNGLGEDECKIISFDAASREVRESFTPLVTEQRIISVLCRDEILCGHCLIELDQLHRYTGRSEGALIDTFITVGHDGRGLSRPLSSYGISMCRERGCEAVTGTVLFDGGPRGGQVLDGLMRHGWQQEYLLWRKETTENDLAEPNRLPSISADTCS